MRFSAAAWVGWWLSALVAVSLIDAPVFTATVLAASLFVGATFEIPGEGRAYRVMLKVALVLLVVRVVLFGLAGHTGPTTLVLLPELRLPELLGGLTLGGRITAEVLAQEAAEGLRVAAVLVTCGVLISVTPVSSLLRLLPARLRSASLILTIAVSFVPHLVTQARRVREAQRLRGLAGGARGLRAMIVPVAAGAIDRSFDLAASMESRGYGSRAPVRVRERLTAYDRATLWCSALTVAAALWLRGVPGARWYAYPVLTFPAVDPRVLMVAVWLCAPVAIAALRARALRRASALQEVPA